MRVNYAQWQWEESSRVPRSLQFNDIYHSRAGGLEQSKEVYIRGNGFPERWEAGKLCTILETGFGFGLNFLCTWQAWKLNGEIGNLHYFAVEAFPWQKQDLAEVLSAFPELNSFSNVLLEQWDIPLPGFHRLVFEGGRIVLTLAHCDVLKAVKECAASIDAFYFDGFAPEKNPDMWSVYLFKRCATIATMGATLATYSVAGVVRKALTEAGFVVKRVEGFGGKRQRLIGHYEGFETTQKKYARQLQNNYFSMDGFKNSNTVAVIGAGIAGCSIAERLAARGIRVELFERYAEPAQLTSGNISGVVYPLMTQDGNRSDSMTRSAYLWWQRQRKRWQAHGMIGEFNGVLQLAKSEKHALLQQKVVQSHGYPEAYVRYLDQETASKYAGYPVGSSGWWFPQGGWINPASLCRSMLAIAEKHIHAHWNTDVLAVYQNDQGWCIETSAGTYEAEHVIFANAWESKALLPDLNMHFKRIYGQTHSLMPNALAHLKVVICQDGYIIPSNQGYGCIGATFERDEIGRMNENEALESNITRVLKMLPTINIEELKSQGGRLGCRTVTEDRLPMVGLIQAHSSTQHAALWGLLALGSRGLVWAPWCAELLVSALCKEALPGELSLWKALSPLRFHRSDKKTVLAALGAL
ncbi:MAG: bifunctional tRNA (5-methylaminomethyl-2-thiouridine)(34)-methyltransferase MnmD/FAD-dependent 5-carboxymethylaminomethyl-2-thiouridine(34) oxidoreductase MnmC [Pseudomonadota bacterium]